MSSFGRLPLAPALSTLHLQRGALGERLSSYNAEMRSSPCVSTRRFLSFATKNWRDRRPFAVVDERINFEVIGRRVTASTTNVVLHLKGSVMHVQYP